MSTACSPDSDTVALKSESDLVAKGKLRVRLAFPRGHDLSVKNTPGLDWSQPESHSSKLDMEAGYYGGSLINRIVGTTHYSVSVNDVVKQVGPHLFSVGSHGSENDRAAAPYCGGLDP